MIKEYLERLKSIRGFSENTVKNYARTIYRFDDYCRAVSFNSWGVNDCENIKIHLIDSFINKQRFNGKDVRTCNNYLACIKLYLRFCILKDRDTEDPRKIMFAREHKKKIDSLTDEELNKLFSYFKNVKAKTHTEEIIKTRNLLIMQLLLYTWLRVSELANIKIKDIAEEMQIIGKWGKRRVINLYKEDLDLIDLYLFLRKDIEGEYLFISLSKNSLGRKLSTVSIEKVIRKAGEKSWVDKKVFPHILRHTFATKLLRWKANIFHIQQLLGHASIQTTQAYLTVLNSELRDTQRIIRRH